MARAYLYLAVPIPLLVMLALELSPSPAPITIPPAPRPAARIITPAASNPRIEAAVLLARPLFSPLRRPATAAPPPAPQPPRLSGIVVTGSARYAIFVPDSGAPTIAAKGQLIGHFEIRDITGTQVIISGPNGILTLHTSNPHAAPAAASQAPAMPSNTPPPVILPGGITLYPPTKETLPTAAGWPGTRD